MKNKKTELEKKLQYLMGKKYDGMMSRCYRESDASYRNYGERGIRVCSAWIKSIDSFKEWLKHELDKQNISLEYFVENSRKIQLDRKDSDGHYTPENCRLVSSQNNIRNRRGGLTRFESAEGEIIEV